MAQGFRDDDGLQVVHGLPGREGGLPVLEVPLFERVRNHAALVGLQMLQERHRLDEGVVSLPPARSAF